MRAFAALLTLTTLLAGCGADGPPVPPPPREQPPAETTPEPGVTISGTAEVGVTGTL